MTMGPMISWDQILWIFVPVPFYCVLLLSLRPSFGSDLRGRIFSKFYAYIYRIFTRVPVGRLQFRMVHVWIGASTLILGKAIKGLQLGIDGTRAPCFSSSCPYHEGESLWYRRTLRYRAERNFWLSFFTLALWLLVYKLYMLKEQITKLYRDLEKIKSARRPKKVVLKKK